MTVAPIPALCWGTEGASVVGIDNMFRSPEKCYYCIRKAPTVLGFYFQHAWVFNHLLELCEGGVTTDGDNALGVDPPAHTHSYTKF